MGVIEEHIVIKRVLNGDIHAFEEIVTSYQDMVFTLAFRILQNREEAEEAAQDVFIKVYKGLRNFNQKSKLSTWIYRITYNTTINRLRSFKRKPELIDIEKTSETETNISTDALFEMGKKERVEIIKQSISMLPETESVIVTLYYYEELAINEIAEITGITRQNVKVKLFRSRQKLYNELAKKIDRKILDYEYN